MAAKQNDAELHYEGEPSPITVTPAPTKPPIMPTPIPKVGIVKKVDITVGSVNGPNEPLDNGLLHDRTSLM